ncbi:prosaposin-like isoform X2 [Heterodontus francisci]|uniref:prosaposin-like isoform X2 n=1 Tax=Heterodontus francisci TaxID=7792 RepID=UPI00355C81EB
MKARHRSLLDEHFLFLLHSLCCDWPPGRVAPAITVRAGVFYAVKKREMAVFVILVSLCLSPVLANFDPKDKACAEGPVYWCQDLKTATQCRAVQYCVQTIWSQPKAASDICEVCKKVIGQIADIVKDKSIQDAVKDALHKGCDLIPVKELSDQCNKYVDSYLPIIIQFLENELQPDVVCAALGLCKSLQPILAQEVLSNAIPEDEPSVVDYSRLNTAGQKPNQEPLADSLPQCTLCLLIVKKLQEYLPKEKTEAAIIQLLNQICSYLPDKYSSKCHNFVETYGKAAIDMLFEKIGPNAVCAALHLCFIKEDGSSVPLYELKAGISCGACEDIVRHLGSARRNGTEVDALLADGCKSLSAVSHFVCEDFVHSYKPQLGSLLQKSQEGKDICAELDICVRKKYVHLLGVNECTWGPAHWCKDLEIATRCNAVEHCKKHVWN